MDFLTCKDELALYWENDEFTQTFEYLKQRVDNGSRRSAQLVLLTVVSDAARDLKIISTSCSIGN